MATNSIGGALLQIACICAGVGIYYPFIKLHKKMQEVYAKEKIKLLVDELKEKEQENEKPKFITRADSLGLISRMLIEDLKAAIENKGIIFKYASYRLRAQKDLAEIAVKQNKKSYHFIADVLKQDEDIKKIME